MTLKRALALVLRYFTTFVYDVVVRKFTFAISSPDEFLSSLSDYKNQEATIALCAIMACGVSPSNAAHVSHSPQSNTRRAIAVRDVSLSQLAPHIHQFANCHRTRPAAAV